MNEMKLVKKAKAGDLKAFQELLNIYDKNLFLFCLNLTKNPQHAEELYQDVFIKAFRNIHKLQEENKFKGWLFTIARNNFITNYNSKKYQENLEINEEVLDLESLKSSPNELKLLVDQVMKSLSAEDRQIIFLTYYEGYASHEIEEIMGVKASTVRSKVDSIREKLFQYFVDNKIEVTGLFKLPKKGEVA